MSLLPFLSALFLLINPALLWMFKRFDQNLQKLQFWVMLTAGMAWLISLAFFFFTPDVLLNPIWNAGFELLPSLAFSLDWVSGSAFLTITALIFFGILVEGHAPQTNALITGLGGICVIGALMDSAYTLALIWTVIEVLVLYSFLKNGGDLTADYRYILAVLVRLAAPILVIYASLNNSANGIAPFITELPSSAAPILFSAGVIGFGGWFLTPRISREEKTAIRPGKYLTWMPSVLGLVLIIRSAQILGSDQVSPLTFWIAAILIFLIFLANLLFNQPHKIWKIGSLALLIAGFGFAAPETVITWGTVFLLPGLVLFRSFGSKRTASLALIIGGIGILPLPFFPSWVGLVSLDGIPGLFFSAMAGMFLGRIFNDRIQIWRKIEIETEQISPLTITGYAVIVSAQFSIAIQAGLIEKSLAFSSIPVGTWIAALLFGVAVLFWDRVPEINLSRLDKLKGRAGSLLDAGRGLLPRFADEVVYMFTRLFEGDGGLIWTLLLGFLIIALISGRGG